MIRSRRTRINYLFVLALLVLGACSDDQPDINQAPTQGSQLTILAFDSGEGSSTPHLSVGPSGPVMSWVRNLKGMSSLYVSAFDGTAWSPETLVASGDNWFNNWADFPSVVPIKGDLWAAHWLVKSADQYYAYDVFVSISKDAGSTWQSARKMHSDGTASEHGFVSLYNDAGDVGVVWLDGRNTVKKDAAKVERGMTLRSARISNVGHIVRPLLVDNLTCDCCGTDVVNTSHGPMVVYRDRLENETRDIAAAHLTDAGWTRHHPVGSDNWIIKGCPVNGPALDSRENQVVVAWYTRAQDRSRVNLAWSDDGGLEFSDPIEIATSGTRGRVDVVLLDKDQAAISWLEVQAGADEAGLMLRYVSSRNSSRNNRKGNSQGMVTGNSAPIEITRLENSRSAGFPQMVGFGDALFFAWTDSVNRRVIAATYQ